VVDNRYRILARVGEGGMGTVYSAEHLVLARKAAVKVLRPELCRDPRAVERFMREARAASSIAHAHVVEVFDTGRLPDGQAYYVMEFLQGENLASTLDRDGPLPWSRVRGIALQICAALSAVHAQGIVHRDLKPENCFRMTRTPDADYIKVLDFGIAKISAPGEEPAQSLTNTGEVLGTTLYMAPEQASGLRIDHRVDIYALGVIMFQLLTDRLPFTGENTLQVLTAILTRDPPMMCHVAPNIDISDAVEALVARAMHRNRDERHQDVASLSADLEALTEAANPQRPPIISPLVARVSANHQTLALAATEMHTSAAPPIQPPSGISTAAPQLQSRTAPAVAITTVPQLQSQTASVGAIAIVTPYSPRPTPPRARFALIVLTFAAVIFAVTLALKRRNGAAEHQPVVAVAQHEPAPPAQPVTLPPPTPVPSLEPQNPPPEPQDLPPEPALAQLKPADALTPPPPKPTSERKPARSGQSVVESVIRDRCSAKIQLARETVQIEIKSGRLVALDAVDPRFKGNAFVRCARDAIERSAKIQDSKPSLKKQLDFKR
jgi:serine/threonine protein kinase